MKRDNLATKGFTLIEVITTLLIVSIMSSIVIPSMTGWIDKSTDKVCAFNRAQLLRYYTYEKSLNYGTDANVSLAEMLAGKYPETAGDVAAAHCPSNGVYTANGEKVVCSIHGDGGGKPVPGGLVYNGSADTAPDKYLKEALENGAANGGAISHAANIDSTAPDGPLTALVKDYFAAQGWDLSPQNVKTWAIEKESGISTFFWSDQDISNMTDGTMVRVVRYNPSKQTYTAGYMKVVTSGAGNYMVLDQFKSSGVWEESSGQTAATKGNYEKTLEVFNGMAPVKP